MEYKISEVVAKTGVPKSTILYYIKEGMLPEARKLKSNVHRYSDEHVERLKCIRYMQEEVGSSNEQIKTALGDANHSLSSSLSMLKPLLNALGHIPTGTKHYKKSQFINAFELDAKLVDRLLKKGILIPTDEDDFTQKDAAIVKLITMYERFGIALDILEAYVEQAKILAALELQIQQQLCVSRTDKNFSELWKLLYETFFSAKPYLFDRTLYHALNTLLEETPTPE